MNDFGWDFGNFEAYLYRAGYFVFCILGQSDVVTIDRIDDGVVFGVRSGDCCCCGGGRVGAMRTD